MTRWVLIAALLSAACGEELVQRPQGAAGVDPARLDLERFALEVRPELVRSCAQVGTCHATSVGAGLQLSSGGDALADLTSVARFVDLASPEASPLLTEATGVRDHAGGAVWSGPFEPGYRLVLDWIVSDPVEQAPPPTGEAPVCATAAPVDTPYDFGVFQVRVAPVLRASCSSANCHAGAATGGRLRLWGAAEPRECAERHDFLAVQPFLHPRRIDTSPLLARPLAPDHGDGAVFPSPADPGWQALRDWVAALGEPQEGLAPAPVAPPAAADDGPGLDPGMYRREIAPWLANSASPVNCADQSCHAGPQATARGGLVLQANAPEAGAASSANRASLARYVDVQTPDASELLRRAAGEGGHRFVMAGDHEAAQAVVDWAWSGRPSGGLDEVFFAEQVMPIFDDPAAVESGDLRLTCASVGACHGTYDPDAPGEGGRLRLIPAPMTAGAMRWNFVQASRLVRPGRPDASPLLTAPLYQADGGGDHPGGDCFSKESDAYQTLLTWASGLRPDADGRMHHWRREYAEDGRLHAEAWLVLSSVQERTLGVQFESGGAGRVLINGLPAAPSATLRPGANPVIVDVVPDEGGAADFSVVLVGDLTGVTVRLSGDDAAAALPAGGLGGPGGPDQAAAAYARLDRQAFVDQVLPVLSTAGGGCAEAGGGTCHSSRAGGFYLPRQWAGDDGAIDRILASVARSPVVVLDPARVDDSRLLSAPLWDSGVSHRGGKPWWSADDAGYRVVRDWIAQAAGAP